MSKRDPERITQAAHARIRRIQETISAFDYLCSGTLVERYKVCGKRGCRCARNRRSRHGPYYEWGYMEGGKQVHRMVTSTQAQLLRTAIANYRAALKLLRQWEAQTVRTMDLETRRN